MMMRKSYSTTSLLPVFELYDADLKNSDGYEPDSNSPPCECALARSLTDEKNTLTTPGWVRTKRKAFVSFKTFFRFCAPSNAPSIKLVIHVFIIWTLLFAPLLNDFLQFSFPQSRRVSIGGVKVVQGCHPGNLRNGGVRPPIKVNQVPFQRNEFVPKMSEQTIGASGPSEGPIYRDSKRYNTELVPNFNPDIEFRDEEHTNEDRMMTQTCRDRLNVLAIAVINQWPGIKLRVTESWDDPVAERTHPKGSLHYEGRAVDITTSDQDRSKYPVLARLAVNAGFDWVLYKTSHIHCSVKSESSGAPGSRGCFPGDSLVHVPGNGTARMDELVSGDQVYSVNSRGEVVPDTIITFMDINRDKVLGETAARFFVSIETESGHSLRLTRNHLVHVLKSEIETLEAFSTGEVIAIFAGNVREGDLIFVNNATLLSTSIVRPTKVININHVTSANGAYAPLTTQGTILVDGALASCYAVIESERAAHIVISPLRYYHMAKLWASRFFFDRGSQQKNPTYSKTNPNCNEGILIYAKFLFHVSQYLIPEQYFWGE